MKLSKACILGLIGCILLSLNIIINFITVSTSEYYTADAFNTSMWIMSIAGWILMAIFLFFFWSKCKKLDRKFFSNLIVLLL